MRLGKEFEIGRHEQARGEQPIYFFGPFTLDSTERRLFRQHAGPVVLPGKAWQILVMLVEAGGRLVTHETFRSKLWPNAVVEDRTLTVHMSTLRKALGAGPSSGYIETVAGIGYRLSVPVRVLSRTSTPPRATDVARSHPLAVRPFSTGGVGAADSYLGVGMADALATALGSVPGLSVSPVDAMEERADATDTIEAGRALGVGHVLEGSVQLQDEQLQVSARLIEIASGRTQWSERFAQPKQNGPEVQDAIVQRVANSIGRESNDDGAALHSYRPRSTEAYFLQLQARASLRLFVRLPTMKALGLFERAVALDPDYALAHAGLASTYLHLGSTALVQALPSDEAMPIARKSAERALALDDRLAEAWAVLGREKMEYEWDWDGAEADLAHAVALNPSSVEALTGYGEFLSAMAYHREAIETMEKARRLDPRNVQTLQHLALAYWLAGDGERAIAVASESQSISPQAIQVVAASSCILDHAGRHEEGMAARIAFLRGLPEARLFAEELEELNRSEGWREAMMAWLARLERKARWETAAVQWMVVDEPERALDALEHCVSQKATYIRFAAVLPPLLPLHNHPRFQRILGVLNLQGRVSARVSSLIPESPGNAGRP
jgi:DNA-binding winged helix-turn-helix (wHTH) protein/tetratricopeptide (TPR) repeat protein